MTDDITEHDLVGPADIRLQSGGRGGKITTLLTEVNAAISKLLADGEMPMYLIASLELWGTLKNHMKQECRFEGSTFPDGHGGDCTIYNLKILIDPSLKGFTGEVRCDRPRFGIPTNRIEELGNVLRALYNTAPTPIKGSAFEAWLKKAAAILEAN